MRFEVRTQEITLNNEVYVLKPIQGKYLESLMDIATKLEGVDENSAKIPSGCITQLHEVAMATMERSYPEDYKKDKESIEAFVTQNLFKLLEPIMKVNIKAE